MDKSAKIYVAGHRGLVGSAIVRCLKTQGYTNIVYRTWKKGDDDEQGGSEYIHRFSEESNHEFEPYVAVDAEGYLWLCGGSYHCHDDGSPAMSAQASAHIRFDCTPVQKVISAGEVPHG